ncbi:MAG: ketoacyl-ACP synthase III [Bacteroidales bacterium]
MKTIIHNIKIAAIASYVPETVLELSSLAAEYGEREVDNIIKTTGIERVRISGESQTSSDMCFEAAIHLIKKENIDIAKIDGLVFVSQTTDYILPATSVILQDRLELSKETVCIDIHYGCSGYIYGLFQAALWISSGACKNVLVLSGDTTSKMIHPKDKSMRMVFGDAGTATLVSKGTSTMAFNICSDGSGYDQLIVKAGGFRMPKSEQTKDLIEDEDNNIRTLEDLSIDGLGIFSFVISEVHPNVNAVIDQMCWDKDNVNLFAFHQANKYLLSYVQKRLKVPAEKIPMNVLNYGNTGPASIPLLLSDIYSSKNDNLEKVVLCGFGVGLSWGSIACDLRETHFYEPLNK